MQMSVPPANLYLLFAWATLWNGLGLWKAAKCNQRNWFIAMLVLGPFTLYLPQIIYLFVFAKEKYNLKNLMFWKQ